MNLRQSAYACTLLIAACVEPDPSPPRETTGRQLAVAKPPAIEKATWKKVGTSFTPDMRYLHAATWDETRKVLLVFGGMVGSFNQTPIASQDLWEWNPATGIWTDRTPLGVKPSARSGAAMVFDATRNKVVLFGGRAGSGYNLEDTWEWDPVTGQFTDRTGAGMHPGGRSQHGMVFEKSTGKTLLLGGGRSDPGTTDGASISLSLGDTWEWDPTTSTWAERKATPSPSARHDMGLVWDSVRSRAILFGGFAKDQAGVGGLIKQDIWEWSPETATWVDRTVEGTKPSARYGHAMAFDASRGKTMVLGGFDISTGYPLGDLWEWDGTTGAWTQRLLGTEEGLPARRIYATLVPDVSRSLLVLFGGIIDDSTMGGGGVWGGTGGAIALPPLPIGSMSGPTRELWDLDAAKAAFTNRSAALNSPGPRTFPAVAYCPASAKTVFFGGYDENSTMHDDTWEWNGEKWTLVPTVKKPSARASAAMAYDPARKSLVLFGGQADAYMTPFGQSIFDDMWEWNCATREWSLLSPTTKPDPLFGHGMVTDASRGKVLLFGGMSNFDYKRPPLPGVVQPDAGVVYRDPMRNEVWEWDGASTTWSHRSIVSSKTAPSARQYPVLSFDETRQKLFLFEGNMYGPYLSYLEWDPYTAGWTNKYEKEMSSFGGSFHVAYDSIRRRQVIVTDAFSPISSAALTETWELEPKGSTFYVRTLPNSPSPRYQASIVFDSGRGVVVLVGGNVNGFPSDETWEYSVRDLANGAGCSAAFATLCSSGNCVEGVCCGVASCSGPCQSCAVEGKEGACVQAAAGTEVPGSCSNGQACDGLGACKAKNGQACTEATGCASGHCVDGVCCDTACGSPCMACHQAGRVGTCTAYQAGSDPQSECTQGTGACKSTCDGVGACAFPPWGTTCGACSVCDGNGSCYQADPYCGGFGGAGGKTTWLPGGAGGNTGYGGSPSYTGGSIIIGGIRAGGTVVLPPYGGTTAQGGSPMGGAGGAIRAGGTTTTGIPRSGGVPGVGGTGGLVRTGGSSLVLGDGGLRDALPTKSDGSAPIDGQTLGKLSHSGCSCHIGQASPSGGGLTFALLGLGLAVTMVRRRRR